MSDEHSIETSPLTALTADIVSTYVAHNTVPTLGLVELISQVHAALRRAAGSVEPEPEPLVPAVPVKKSVMPDHIVCLEDGKKFRSLKRHLRTDHNLTPEEYRQKWGLPHDYPMVAPEYSASRSALAKSLGLGRLRTRGKAAATTTAGARKSRARKNAVSA